MAREKVEVMASGAARATTVSRRATQRDSAVLSSAGEEEEEEGGVMDLAKARMVEWGAVVRRRWRRWRREMEGEEGERERAVVRFVVRKTVCEPGKYQYVRRGGGRA